MLKNLHKSAFTKSLVFGFIILGMAGLVLSDSTGSLSLGSQTGHIAKVDGEKIPPAVFDAQMRNAMQRIAPSGVSVKQAIEMGLANEVLNQMVSKMVISKAANDAHILPDDTAAAREIRAGLQDLTAQGISEKDALQRLLTVQGMTEGMLVSAVKEDIKTATLMRAVAAGSFAPQAMTDAVFRYTGETRQASYFTLSQEDIPAQPAPSEEDLKAFYDTHANMFSAPESRDVTYTVLPRDHFSKGMVISDADVEEAYNQNRGDFARPASVTAEQAVADDKTTAAAISAAVAGGMPMFDAAKLHGAVYLKAEKIDPASVQEEIAAALTDVKDKGLIDPIETSLGVVVMNVTDYTAVQNDIDSLREEIRSRLKNDMESDRLYNAVGDIEDALSGGTALSDLADEYKLPALATVKNLGKDGKGLPLENLNKEAALASIFETEQGNGRVIERQDGSFLLVHVTTVTESKARAFDDVRKDVEKAFIENRNRTVLQARAQEAADKIRAGNDIAAIAREYGGNLKRSADLTRRSEAPQGMPAGFTGSLFTLMPGKDAAVLGSPDGKTATVISVGAFRNIDNAAINRNGEEYKAAKAILARDMQNTLVEQFRLGLIEKYNVEVNERALNEYIARYTAQD